MISNEIREKLQDIIRGARLQRTTDRCSADRSVLIESFGAGSTVKTEFESRSIIKEKQVGFLKGYAKNSGLWLESLPRESEYYGCLAPGIL